MPPAVCCCRISHSSASASCKFLQVLQIFPLGFPGDPHWHPGASWGVAKLSPRILPVAGWSCSQQVSPSLRVVRSGFSYWTPLPKKLGGEKHYSVAELDEEFAVETNNFGLGRRGGREESSLICVPLAPSLQKIMQTSAFCHNRADISPAEIPPRTPCLHSKPPCPKPPFLSRRLFCRESHFCSEKKPRGDSSLTTADRSSEKGGGEPAGNTPAAIPHGTGKCQVSFLLRKKARLGVFFYDYPEMFHVGFGFWFVFFFEQLCP